MTDSQYRPTPLAFERLPAHEQTARLQVSVANS